MIVNHCIIFLAFLSFSSCYGTSATIDTIIESGIAGVSTNESTIQESATFRPVDNRFTLVEENIVELNESIISLTKYMDSLRNNFTLNLNEISNRVEIIGSQIDDVSKNFDTKITNSETRINDLKDQISSIRKEVNGEKSNFGIIIACIVLTIVYTLILLVVQRINRYRKNQRLIDNNSSNPTDQTETENNNDYIDMQKNYTNN